MARHYSQREKHIYVYWLVQQIVDTDRRAAKVEQLAKEHKLTTEQQQRLAAKLQELDARRAAKAEKEAARRAKESSWTGDPATAQQIAAIHRMRHPQEGDAEMTKGEARSEIMRLRAAHRRWDRETREASEIAEYGSTLACELANEIDEQAWEQAEQYQLRGDYRESREDAPATGTEEVEVAGYLLRRVGKQVAIIGSDGELLAEKEINGQRHWDNFVAKFGRDKAYRESYLPKKSKKQPQQQIDPRLMELAIFRNRNQ